LRNSKRRLAVVALVTTMLVACSGAGSEDGTTTTVAQGQPVADGTWFAFVTVGEDETGEMTLGIDLAEMLSGEEARVAAVEDGVIAEGEDLPNDLYIDNDEEVLELLHVSEGAQFDLTSGLDSSEKIHIDASILAMVYEGTYTGDPLYGVSAGTPIAMDVTISDGLVSDGQAVYLP
jgi:hypothetical protein